MTKMRHTMRVLGAALMAVSVLGGCQAMTGKTAGQTLDDTTITTAVKAKLVGDKAANLMRVDVDTNNATVYLNGVVETPDQKTRAEQLARQAKGVKNVVNNLQIQKK
jgi:hyperosmotically inducible periplasmic protein